MCMRLLISIENLLEAIWIIPASAIAIAFIITAILAINDERAKREQVKDYNELRKTIILTKFHAHEMNNEESYAIMICNSRNKNMITKHCRDCVHAYAHPKTDECDKMNCEQAVVCSQ